MSLKNVHIETSKLAIGTPDLSKTTFPDLMGSGTLVNPGVSLFGGALSIGAAKAAVNIGPPIAIPPLSMPFSLWVDGISVFMGITNFVGARFSFAFCQENGFHQKNGASNANGANIKNAIKIANTIEITNGLAQENAIAGTAGVTVSPVNTCYAMKNKPFDIPHPIKENKRIRHICSEGPEAGIYIRGRLTGKNMIELPEYWDGLVDRDSITVNLTQIKTSQDLIVDSIEKDCIKIISGNASKIDCFYQVWVARWVNPITQEKLHVVYDGMSPDDYPGDNSIYSINK